QSHGRAARLGRSCGVGLQARGLSDREDPNMTPIERAWRGTKSDWRLHSLSVFSVAVAFVCLASALLVVVNVSHVRDRWASTGRASVYLKKGAEREQIATIERALRASAGVTDVKYVSSEDARHDMTGQSD